MKIILNYYNPGGTVAKRVSLLLEIKKVPSLIPWVLSVRDLYVLTIPAWVYCYNENNSIYDIDFTIQISPPDFTKNMKFKTNDRLLYERIFLLLILVRFLF